MFLQHSLRIVLFEWTVLQGRNVFIRWMRLVFSAGVWWKERKKSECHPYTNDTRFMKMSLPVRLPYAHRVVRRFRKELPGAPSPRDYRGEAASSHATSWGLWLRRRVEETTSLLSPSTMPENVSHLREMMQTLQTGTMERQLLILWTPTRTFW